MAPTVSVIIPAFNALPLLDVQLEALDRQTYGLPFEVIVSDNGSTDGLRQHLATHPLRDKLRIAYVWSGDQRGSAHARNVGAQHASGDLLVFCDADDRVKPHWLETIARNAVDFDVIATALDGESLNDVPHRHACASNNPEQILIGCSFAVSAKAWCELGGQNTAFMALQDTEFGWRAQLAGKSYLFIDEPLVAYRNRSGVGAALRKGIRLGKATEQLRMAYPARIPDNNLSGRMLEFLVVLTMNPLFPRRGCASLAEWALLFGIPVGRLVSGFERGTIRWR